MIQRGHLLRTWDTNYRDYTYTRQPLQNYELAGWREAGYTHTHFSGCMYDSTNEMPDWVNKLADDLGLNNPGFVFYRMQTGEIMPNHVDHFQTYKRIFNAKLEDIRRAVILLEDWKPGHYLEVDHKAYVNWHGGDYIMWSPEVDHAASNIGVEDRYTLQITGTQGG